MAVKQGIDYIYGRGSCGDIPELGEGILLGTHKYLLIMPTAISDYQWDSTTTFSFRMQHSTDLETAIEAMLALDDFGPRDLEEFLLAIGDEFEEAILHHLAEIKRLKFRNGFFTRGIYLSKSTDARNDWHGHRLFCKSQALMFQKFYSNIGIECKTSGRLVASIS